MSVEGLPHVNKCGAGDSEHQLPMKLKGNKTLSKWSGYSKSQLHM
jgi:hypothetical protein